MDEWDKPRFGEAAVSWQTIWDRLYPDYMTMRQLQKCTGYAAW